jgi:hypothetical protein
VLAVFAIICGLIMPGTVCGQTAAGPQFQFSSLMAYGNTVVASRVPVVTSTGTTVYQDVTLQFDSDGAGNLTLTSGFPLFVLSPNLQVSSFQAGNYVGPANAGSGKFLITITGPGVMSGGATAWTIVMQSGADNCTAPSSATFYVGPIASSPLASRLQAAGLTSNAWSYGVANSSGCYHSGTWYNNSLIGVSQVGNTITIASFTSYNADNNTPVDQITYVLTH